MSSKANKRNLPTTVEANKKKQKPAKQRNNKPKPKQHVKTAQSLTTQSIVESPYNLASTYAENASNNNTVPNAANNISLTVPANPYSIQKASQAFVNFALSRGWNSQSTYGSGQWYFALLAIQRILSAYMTGSSEMPGKLPHCLVVLGNYLAPKTDLPLWGGKISYAWSGAGGFPETNISYGCSSNTGTQLYGVYGTTTVPNTPCFQILPITTVPGVETQDQALMDMWAFCQSSAKTPYERYLWRLVNSNTIYSRYSNDSSAFAYSDRVDGGAGSGAPGGFAVSLRHELPIQTPLFSVFAYSGDTSDKFARFPEHQRRFSGDALSNIGFYISGLIKEDALHMKTAPVFKFVNFESFSDVLAQYYSEVCKRAANDSQILASPAPASLIQSQLEFVDMRYALRNDLMYMFSKTQPFVTGIFPQDTTDVNTNWSPLAAGFGQQAYRATDNVYPVFLVENARMMTYRVSYTGRGGKRNPQLYIPVLGMASGQIPVWKEYTYGAADNPSADYTFSTPVIADISMLDGSVGSSFADLVNIDYLNSIASRTTEWLTGLSAFTQSLTKMGVDAGPGMDLISKTLTVFNPNDIGAKSITVPRDLKREKSKDKEDKVALKFQKMRKTVATPEVWNSQIEGIFTSSRPFLNACLSVYNNFIMPSMPIVRTLTDAETHLLATEQMRTRETHKLTQLNYSGSQGNVSTLGSRQQRFAVSMTHARNAELSELEISVQEAIKHGEGGIFSSLIGSAIKALVPESAPIVDTIAGLVPI